MSPDLTAACVLEALPGPGDEPPREGGDLIDTSSMGGGRWRLCLIPGTRTVEGTAWCEWDAERTTILAVNGLPARAGPLSLDAGIAVGRREFEFHSTDARGMIANYRSVGVQDLGADSGGFDGLVRFAVVLQPDPEGGAPPGAVERFDGLFRWECGAAPPRD